MRSSPEHQVANFLDKMRRALGLGNSGRSASMSQAQLDVREADAAYRNGDFEKAQRLLHPLAEQGGAVAQCLLGVMYSFGEGVPQDDAIAARWTRLGAE